MFPWSDLSGTLTSSSAAATAEAAAAAAAASSSAPSSSFLLVQEMEVEIPLPAGFADSAKIFLQEHPQGASCTALARDTGVGYWFRDLKTKLAPLEISWRHEWMDNST